MDIVGSLIEDYKLSIVSPVFELDKPSSLSKRLKLYSTLYDKNKNEHVIYPDEYVYGTGHCSVFNREFRNPCKIQPALSILDFFIDVCEASDLSNKNDTKNTLSFQDAMVLHMARISEKIPVCLVTQDNDFLTKSKHIDTDSCKIYNLSEYRKKYEAGISND